MSLFEMDPQVAAAFIDAVQAGVRNGETAKQVQEYLEESMGETFGLRRIQRHMKKVKERKADKKHYQDEQKEKPAGDVLKDEGTGSDSRNLTLEAERVVTLEDALRKGNVDLRRWDVERYVVNSWEVGAKGPDKRIRVTPLWQVKVWLKAKNGWSQTEFKEILSSDLRKLAPSYRTLPPKDSAPLLAELSIFDAHFGKMGWSPETGQDYDLKICRDRYMAAGRDLLSRAAKEKPERVLYVVGQDFFHTDHKGLTTNGTPQDVDGRWQKAFRIGTQCCITLAEEATQLAPVDILVVPGNHDREKAFCLGEVLAARFHTHGSVNVMNSPDVYAYYRWGKVLLGFVHGDNHGSQKKRGELPQQMATDRPADWAETVWREIHMGHFHSETEDVWKFRKVEHIRDMAVRVLPSLSSTDAWHRQSGYASVLAAECFLYHKDRGRYSILSYCAEA